MICLGGFGRLALCAALVAGLAARSPLILAAALAHDLRTLLVQNHSTERLDTLKRREEELKTARDQQRKSAETETALRREIEQIGADRRKLNQDLIDTASRLRGVESKIE